MAYTDFIAAIDLGSSHMVGMVGTKGPAGTLSIIAYEVENSDTCIRRGCVYNIKDAAGKIVRLIRKLENKLGGSRIGKVYIGVGGQSLRSINHAVSRVLGSGTVTEEVLKELDQECRQYRPDMLDVLDEMGGRLYLLGSKPGVAEEAGRRILEQHPNIVLCGVHDGYFQDSDPVAHEVAQAQPDLLFVCLGAPKQEKWITRFGLLTGAKLAIGLGGALDVFAGNVERAPEQWQKLGMEWAYRLVKEPKRIGRMAKLPLVLVKAAGRRASGRGKQRVL